MFNSIVTLHSSTRTQTSVSQSEKMRLTVHSLVEHVTSSHVRNQMFAFRNSQLSFLSSRAQCNVDESFPLTSSGNGYANSNNNGRNNYSLTEWFNKNLAIVYAVIGAAFVCIGVIFTQINGLFIQNLNQ